MAQIEINEARIRAEFGELARIDSESFGERELADRLKEKLAELGIQAKEDDTAEKIGGNAGNLFRQVKRRTLWNANPAVRTYGHGGTGNRKEAGFS